MHQKYPFLFQIAESTRTSSSVARGLTSEQHKAQDELRSQVRGQDFGGGVILPWYSAPADTVAGQEMRSRHLRTERRAMGVTIGGGGNYLVGEDVPEVAQSLRDALVLERLGARVIGGLRNNVKFPRGRAQLAAEWLSETAEAEGTDELLASLALTPHRVTAYLDVSDQLLMQGTAAEPFLRNELFGALAEEIQRVAIAGKGAANEPLGLINTPGMPLVFAGGGTAESTDPEGTAPIYEDFVNMEFKTTGDGKADRGHLAWILSPLFRKKLRTTRRVQDGDSTMVWPDDNPYALLGHAAGVTTGAPDNLGASETCSGVVFGEMSELFLPIWGPGIFVDAVSSREFAITGKVRLVASAYVDSGARIPTAFTAMKDANCRG